MIDPRNAVEPEPLVDIDEPRGTILASLAAGLGFVLLLGIILGGLWYFTRPEEQVVDVRIGPAVPDESAPIKLRPIDFELNDSHGEVFDSDQMRGRIWAVNFFYASCPGPCFIMNQRVGELQKEYAKHGVQFVSITVAPETDTPEVLNEYAKRLDADPRTWRFLTGDAKQIEAIGREMFLASSVAPAHSERLYVVDAEGKWQDFAIMNSVQFALARSHLRKLVTRPLIPADQQKPAPDS